MHILETRAVEACFYFSCLRNDHALSLSRDEDAAEKFLKPSSQYFLIILSSLIQWQNEVIDRISEILLSSLVLFWGKGCMMGWDTVYN